MMTGMGRMQTLQVSPDEVGRSVALVLSAASNPEEVAAVASSVIQSLPARVTCEVYFLGNPSPYSARTFGVRSAHWFSENATRASVVGPLMRRLGGTESTIALIGSGPVFDLEDWLDSARPSGFVVYSVGEPVADERLSAVLLTARDREELLRFLYDPVVSACVSGPGLVPVAWNNAAYRLQRDEGRLQLVSTQAASLEVSVSCLALGADAATCTGQTQSGRSIDVRLAVHDAADSPEGECVQLSESEVRVFRQASRDKPFRCPHCASVHGSQTLHCQRDPAPKYLFGRPVYSTLEAAGVRGLLVCREAAGGVYCETAGRAAVGIGENQVLVLLQGKLCCLAYQEASARWSSSPAPARRYTAIPGDRYVLDYR